jgi:hypothetical protein
MKLWELVRRLLAAANGGGEEYEPDLIGGLYYRQLSAGISEVHQTYLEAVDLATLLAADLQDIGLLRPVHRSSMGRTEFGDELLNVLSGRDVVTTFEVMQVEIDAGEIRRVLHQLNS